MAHNIVWVSFLSFLSSPLTVYGNIFWLYFFFLFLFFFQITGHQLFPLFPHLHNFPCSCSDLLLVLRLILSLLALSFSFSQFAFVSFFKISVIRLVEINMLVLLFWQTLCPHLCWGASTLRTSVHATVELSCCIHEVDWPNTENVRWPVDRCLCILNVTLTALQVAHGWLFPWEACWIMSIVMMQINS